MVDTLHRWPDRSEETRYKAESLTIPKNFILVPAFYLNQGRTRASLHTSQRYVSASLTERDK